MGQPKVAELLLQVANDAADEGKHDVVLDTIRVMQHKPGVQTTEFYIAVVAGAVSFGMQFWPGHEQYGLLLGTVSSAAYILSRGMVKVAQNLPSVNKTLTPSVQAVESPAPPAPATAPPTPAS